MNSQIDLKSHETEISGILDSACELGIASRRVRDALTGRKRTSDPIVDLEEEHALRPGETVNGTTADIALVFMTKRGDAVETIPSPWNAADVGAPTEIEQAVEFLAAGGFCYTRAMDAPEILRQLDKAT